MQLTGLSFAYPEVPANERASLVQPRMPARGDVFILSTCLRVEVVWSGGPDLAPAVMAELYGSLPLPAAKMRTDLDAFHHLARIAAGLESAPIGESEILSQFRGALEWSFAETCGDQSLVHLIEAALGVGRAARRSLSGSGAGSLAHAAAGIAGDRPGVVILGGGAMARAVAHELDRSNVTIYARRPGSVAGNPSRPWRDLPTALASCRAVVSTVPGPVATLAEAGRDGPPLILVDLGMPPALTSPELAEPIIYQGVDDVAASVRSISQPDAEEVAARESEKAWARLIVSDRAGSIITSVFDRADRTVDEEVRRFSGRLSAADDPAEVLRQLAHTVARRILHPPAALLGSTPLTPDELEVVAKAFGIDDG